MTAPHSRAHTSVRVWSCAAAITTAFLGLLVLAGWYLDIPMLETVLPGLPSMKPNTALCFVLGGVSLWILGAPRASRLARHVARACAAAIALTGALTLSEHLFGWNLGIDELLFRDAPRSIGTSSPGRMSPLSALGFVLDGAALLALSLPARAGTAQMLALAAISTGAVMAVGYLFGTMWLVALTPFSATSIHSTVASLTLATGILCARPDAGPMRSLTSDTAAGRTARRLLPAAIVVSVLLNRVEIFGAEKSHWPLAIAVVGVTVAECVVLAGLIWWSADISRRAEEALRASEERVRLATEAAQIGVWVRDIAADRVEWTPVLHALFGLPAGRPITYQMFLELVHPDDREHVARDVREAMAGKPDYAVDYRIIRPDGEIRWIAAHGRISYEHGAPTRSVGVAMDVTDRVRIARMREELLDGERAARATVEKVGRMKDEFLATLSHELRTPLTAILGWSRIARKKQAPPEIARCLDVIERNARLQEQLVADLLDMNRILSGKLRLEMSAVSLPSIVKAALETVRPAADAKQIRCTLRVDLAPDGGVIAGDPGRLQQVVWNLLSNAIKFTPKGGQVDIALGSDDSSLELRVADAGKGIAPEFLPYIFDRFRQADTSTTREHGGLGIGLAITRELVELHGGTVEAESAGVGRGSVFTVRLPLAAALPEIGERAPSSERGARQLTAALPEVDARSAEQEWGRLDGLRVMVVDDDHDTCEMVRRLLIESGADVISLTSAKGALAALERRPPDVIVSDLGMPEMDGFELIRRVRAKSPASGGGVPAVALTAFVRAEDEARARADGYQAFVQKPIEPSRLINTIVSVAAGAIAAAP